MRKRSEPYLASNIDKVNQFQEQILKSFETYYNEMSKQNRYDITVEATITDVSKKPDGIYRVRTNGAEFDAYAMGGSYYKNDIVLVSVPNGDYANQKFILGRKADADENVTFAFKLPFDDFIGLRDLTNKQQIAGKYWANYPLTKENQGDFLNTRIWNWENTGDSTIGNTRLGIEADWTSILGEYYPLRGTYGFRIVIKGIAASGELNPSTEIEREEYFTNRDMYGNTYAFYTPYNQQKVIDISDFLNVHSIEIYYYQDFNFADSQNRYIIYNEYNSDGRPAVPENLGFENVNVYLGVSAQDIKDETTFLYSYDSLGYSSKEVQIGDTHAFTFECEPEEEKKLIFAWVHYEKNGTFSVIKDIDDLIKQREATGKTTHIYWYRFNYDEDITDVERIWKPEYSDLEKDWNDALNNPNYQTQIERYGGEGWTFLPYAIDNFNIRLMPRGNKSREKVKVVIQHDGTHTTSKELVLNNLRDVEAELAGSSRNDKVVIKCFRLRQNVAIEDNSINTFHIYDENNKILYNDDNERFDEHPYYLQVQCRNDDTGLYEILKTISDNDTSNGQQIAWSFPRQYTMIRSTEEVSIEDAKYFGIDATNEPIRFKNFHNSTIKFTINSIFNNRYSNNIVSAVIRQNDKEYHIERDLQFGRAEGLGHEFVPVIEILTPSGGTYLNIGQDFEIGCVVYKKDGTLYENPSLLTFSWREISGKSTFCHYDDEGIQHDGYYISSYTGNDSGFTNKYAGYRENVIKGQLLSNGDITFPPIFEVTVYGAADYPLTIRKGFLICNNFSYKQRRNFYLPSRVEFKSDGANPIYYSDYFEVAELNIAADSSISDYQLEYPQWNINNNNIFELKSEITKRSFLELNSDTSSIQSKDHDYTRYKIQFVSTNPQWTEDLLKPINYTFIYYSVDGIYVAQSIAFDRNYYSSSLVNEWDGTSLTWDEENGAILSTMIAAGSKDGSNKFTGVMMGDWHTKGDESLDTPGLYGFNKGAQTFGFKTDGTGFIGSSGKGRIEFDGTEALISNADRSCYINLNPVNLNNKLTDINNQSFSENFIYCKVKKTDNKFTSATDSINGESSWARSYFQDQDNDYFVVDPNYGVLTTGGVIARYGALGNWMISNEGLYQKDAGKYMYIGYDVTDATTKENQRYCIYAGINPSVIPGQPVADINPYFSVTWDGTMFARKGLIANTWSIDDTSLQYIKSSKKLTNGEIFDKIYIGQGEANNAIIDPIIEAKIYPNENTRPPAKRWAISAGQKTDYTDSAENAGTGTDTDYINFGVTLSGELYSQLGTIGGWKIDQYNLTSLSNNMRFNALDGQIIINEFINKDDKPDQTILIDGTTGTIVLNHTITGGEEDFNTAQIWMAGYALAAKTEDDITYPRISSESSPTNLKGVHAGSSGSASGNPNDWYDYKGGSMETKVTIKSTNYNIVTNDTTFENVDLFQIVSQTSSTGNYGVNLATVEQNNIKTVAFYPTGCTSKYPVLGQKDALWNLYANEIDCVKLNNSGIISAEKFVMKHETVATEPWVYGQLAKIWDALNTTNGQVSGMSGGLSGLAGKINENCVTSLDWSGTSQYPNDGQVEFAVTLFKTLDKKTSIKIEKAPCKVALVKHGHELSIKDGKLSLKAGTVGTDKDVPLSHHHEVSGSMDKDGKLTVTVGDANFTKATGTYTIDCSEWLIEKVKSIWDSNVIVTCTAKDGSGSGSAKAEAVLKWKTLTKTKTHTDYWDCTASHGANIENTGIDVYLNGTFTRYIINDESYYK